MKSFFGTAGFLLVIALIYSAAEAHSVAISRADCTRLVQHVPRADVAYTPGLDANGNPVIPADLGGAPPIKLPERFEIPITVDLRERLGIPADPASYQTQNFTIGTVVWKDNAAWFNGQPLRNEEGRQLALACQRRLAGGR